MHPVTGELLRWTSHQNEMTVQDLRLREGELFGPDHEIWEWLREGDQIGVWMCAKHRGWSNQVGEIVLGSYDWFMPTLI